jgi:hypothetical protein
MKVKHLLVFPHKLGTIYSKNCRDNEGEKLASFPHKLGMVYSKNCRDNEGETLASFPPQYGHILLQKSQR